MNKIKIAAISAASIAIAVLASVGISNGAHRAPAASHQDGNVKGVSADFSNSPYLIVNGTTEWYQYQAFKTGTSTICSFPAPTTGSSTIQYVTWRVTGNSNPNTLEVDIGTSTGSGTTTATLRSNVSVTATRPGIADGYIGSSIPNAILAGSGSSTSAVGTQYVNVVVGTTTVGQDGTTAGLNWQGYCQLETTQY